MAKPDSLEVVVREHVRPVFASPEGVDPRSGPLVPFCPPGARDLPVCDVAHEDMPEHILALAADRRSPLSPHELLARQGVQALFRVGPLDSTDRGRGAEPEHLAEHGGVLQQLFLAGWQGIEARGNDPLQ